MTVKEAREYLRILTGKRLLYIERCCELVNIGFGEFIERKNHKNKVYFVGTDVLHILSPFRISSNNSIVLGSSDLYISNTQDKLAVDLNEPNSCRFDSIVVEQQNFFKNEYIKSVNVNDFGDLSINLQNISISIFNTKSNDEEVWRFFQPDTGKRHLVVFGNTIELV